MRVYVHASVRVRVRARVRVPLSLPQVDASAGTYIKEFCHGDLGRTRPSLADLLAGPFREGDLEEALPSGAADAGGEGCSSNPSGLAGPAGDAGGGPGSPGGPGGPKTGAGGGPPVAPPGGRRLRADIVQLDVLAVNTTGMLS